MEGLFSQWRKDYEAPFTGWDFSYLDGRWIEDKPPWDYRSLASRLVQRSASLLDIGTGGGEVFASLSPLPKRSVAVEDWQPNVTVAQKKLEPLGVKVLGVDEYDALPFGDDEFDTILNRHSAFRATEISRLLKTGGIFLTQQVGGGDLADLMQEFNATSQYGDWTLSTATKQIGDAGLKIEKAEEWAGKVEFRDVGAVAYFLRVVPWVVPDFSLDNNLEHLEGLQRKIDKGERLLFQRVRFLVQASKPAKA